MKFNVDTAAVKAFPLDVADHKPQQHQHNKGYITASGERMPDFGGAPLKCTDELDVKQIDRWSIHGSAQDRGECFANV